MLGPPAGQPRAHRRPGGLASGLSNPADIQGLGRASGLAVAVGAATVLPGFMAGVLALQVRDDLSVDLTAAAAGVSVFFAAGAIGAGPGGRFAQRVGAIVSMRVSLLVSAGCQLAIALGGRSLAALLALLAVAGLANAVAQPSINLFMAQQVPLRRQGLAFGLKQSAIPAAILVSGLALPAVAIPLGWRTAFAMSAGMALVVALVLQRSGATEPADRAGAPEARVTRPLVLLAVGAALASAGPNALSAYLVASAVDVGIAEGAAGVLAAVGSAASLAVRVAVGERADRRVDYGFGVVVALLVLGTLGFALLAVGAKGALVAGALLAFTLGWGWPGMFNLAVVQRHRSVPAAATGVTQTGIYVGAAAGPAAYGVLAADIGYPAAWAAAGGVLLLAAWTIAAGDRMGRVT